MSEDRITDEALMGRFGAAFDQAAFDELMARYSRPALALATDLVGTHATAEDAVQETFIRIVKARRDFDPARSFASWFYTILRNACADLRRKESRRSRQLQALAEQGDPYAKEPPSGGDSADILRALSPADREIMIYRVVHGMTFRELADHLGCSLETAKKRAQRALARLRESQF